MSSAHHADSLEIIAFRLHDQQYCLRTTAIREIRGWGPAMPIPQSSAEIVGVMSLRGTVIPVIDLARKLGMAGTEPTERSAIVVAEVLGAPMGLLVDSVSDILTISTDLLQPVPDINTNTDYAEGIITQPNGMICFLNLERLFEPPPAGS